ncbi:triacylglycerol lipase [Clostridium sp. MSJ-8]|uniref:esterase/lipase family protein n=1 Tax=Clostridium sp. MSJ-8 TaxID=2841510 RepID=UPI001C0F038A|nr:triacylglycerol lipase [Clostridium sp. MSJ-8]MBU5488822.1 triacylglycerol lipase [Clostridium sp. MSJ-8]
MKIKLCRNVGEKLLYFVWNILLVACIEVLFNEIAIITSYGHTAIFVIVGIVEYLLLAVFPCKYDKSKKLKILYKGYRVLELIIWAITISIFIGIYQIFNVNYSTITKVAIMVYMCAIAFSLLVIATIRIVISSRQVSVVDKFIIIFLWWVPLLNIIMLKKICKKAKREMIVENDKILLDEARAENEICATKYPIILVHGVFFRDWQLVNYWGRIPAELIKNGATIYYGKQQSANSVEDSAKELKENILKIMEENNYEKVNIIAHSKGGLDSRYAISKLGLGDKVASLTTINTPHKGCKWATAILNKVSDNFVEFVAKRYEKIFTVLGDTNPDFRKSVEALTYEECIKRDKEMEDCEGVLYQSVMSKMKKASSASFPLNILYYVVKKYDGDNDGLVGTYSAVHGIDMGILDNKHKRGISHGDMIDLNRENIDGFDVREFFVKIVSELKEKGL